MTTSWTFFSNHAHVLFAVARDPDLRVRDLAPRVGITERAAQRILADLVRGGYVVADKVGRRNRYRVVGELPLRHPLEADRNVGELVRWLTG